jgi:small-conductance mechanosensitive channel
MLARSRGRPAHRDQPRRCQMAAQPDQDDLAARTRRATQLRGQVKAALRRARDAHQRAVGVHERAAAFYVAVGDLPAAEHEQHGAALERERLRDADERLAAMTEPA